jgi:hypothetical protein
VIFDIEVACDSAQLYVAQNYPETYRRYYERAIYGGKQYHRDRIPSPSVKKYWEDKKSLNENIDRIKDLLK